MTTSYNQDFVIRQAIAQFRNFEISRTRDTDNYEKATICLTFKVFLLFLLKKKYIYLSIKYLTVMTLLSLSSNISLHLLE